MSPNDFLMQEIIRTFSYSVTAYVNILRHLLIRAII